MDPSAQPFKSRRRLKGKGHENQPSLHDETELQSSSQGTTAETPIFLPQGPPTRKRQRSSTISRLPIVAPKFLREESRPSAYWMNLFHRENKKLNDIFGQPGDTPRETVALIELIYQLHRDYRLAIDTLVDDIEALREEVATLRPPSPRPDTPTPIPFPIDKEVPASTTEPKPQPVLSPQPYVPPFTWATVAKRGSKKDHATAAKPVQVAKPAPTMKPVQQKKGPTARERRLMIKRDSEGGPLKTTMVELRDNINQALSGTYVQTVTIKGNTVTLTTMEAVKATTLNSKVSTFLHLIPGTISVHLDLPIMQLLVHGIPTSENLSTIVTELTTYNPGLVLVSQPRWLTTDTARVGKSASSVVIAIFRPRAPDFVGRRLAAFSNTPRTERRLHFNNQTHCSNCHKFGHHVNKCTAPAVCRWCALPHPTGEHTCPTATCRMRGRPCSHVVLRCVNCGGPHDSHHLLCPSRPKAKFADVDEEEMVDT